MERWSGGYEGGGGGWWHNGSAGGTRFKKSRRVDGGALTERVGAGRWYNSQGSSRPRADGAMPAL